MSDQWKLDGDYFEACNCDAACPCVVLGAPTRGECNVLVAWHIDKGIFGSVTLNNLNVVLAAHAPGHMLEGKWKAALYLDERATEDQRGVLTKIFAGQAGGHLANLAAFIGEVLGVKPAPIEFRSDGKRRSLSIPAVAEMEIEAISGQGGGDVTMSGHPLCVVPGIPSVVARSKRVSYHDLGLQWELTERNGFYSPFSYQG